MSLRGACAAGLRGFAAFLGAFSVVNACLGAPSDANRWWIDVRPAGAVAASVALAFAGLTLVAWALRPVGPRALSVVAAAVAAALAAATGADAVTVVRLDAEGAVRAPGVPLSAILACLFAAVAVVAARGAAGRPLTAVSRRAVAVAFAVTAVVFPLALMLTFGRADYRRAAAAIVVPGARTYADGRPSLALEDRMRTACDLWLDGCAPVLFVSGGPGDGAVHETEAMRAFAVSRGVDPAAIVADPDGTDTAATVRHAAARFAGSRVLVVSHAYHLPRLRLLCDREGLDAATVPARESRMLAKMPWFMAREVAAWWSTWAR